MAITKIDIFKELRELNGYDGKNSINWFRNAAQMLRLSGRNATKDAMLKQGPNLVNRMELGKMYMFEYDAKHKETLPHWDKYPLIFMMDINNVGILGLNMHYLAPEKRLIYFLKLQQFMSGTSDKNKKLKFAWEMVNSATRWPESAYCIKRYLPTHIRTRFLEIPQSDWRNAVNLPLGSFQKQTAQQVWAQQGKR